MAPDVALAWEPVADNSSNSSEAGNEGAPHIASPRAYADTRVAHVVRTALARRGGSSRGRKEVK
jgi:hypothetical protein